MYRYSCTAAVNYTPEKRRQEGRNWDSNSSQRGPLLHTIPATRLEKLMCVPERRENRHISPDQRGKKSKGKRYKSIAVF